MGTVAMPKFDQAGMERKLRDLIRENFPQADLVRVSVRESANYEGEPSLAVDAIFREVPKAGTSRPMARVLDKFRTWLSTEKDDDRFPYIRVFSEEDEREFEGLSPGSGPSA